MLAIKTECHTDKAFAKALFEYDSTIDVVPTHSGIAAVTNFIFKEVENQSLKAKKKKYKAENQKIVGIVDADGNTAYKRVLKDFTLIKEHSSFPIKLYRLKNKNNGYLLAYGPNIEGFLENMAAKQGVKLPYQNLKELKGKLHEDPKFKTFLNNLLQKNPPEVGFIKDCIKAVVEAK